MKTLELKILKENTKIPAEGLVLRATKNRSFWNRRSCAYFCDTATEHSFPYRYPITIQETSEIEDGDILLIFPNGHCEILWDIDKPKGNCLFISEACNAACPMCPQPPSADNAIHHKRNLEVLRLLKVKPEMACITGGEPFLFPARVVSYFKSFRKKFPRAAVSVLTNGICLSNFEVAKEIALNAPWDTLFCVSFHADTAETMREMNRAPDGFARAIRGIINLGRLKQSIEIRPVISKSNWRYLESFALFVYRNFPFVCHVAFMGQEICGNARKNYDQIWVDPIEYSETLANAVRFLDSVGIPTSIYNVPLCLLPRDVWKFCVKSISEWKQAYLPMCERCTKRDSCCGVFTTSETFLSKSISPIIE